MEEKSLKKIITLPNLMSLFRILLIPAFICLYLEKAYWLSLAVVVLSGLTDAVDGFVARRFNMVSDLGKVLDPIADKLTHFSILVCLTIDFPFLIFMTVLLFIREFLLLLGMLFLFKRQSKTYSARWWGKISTVVIYVTILFVVLGEIFTQIPQTIILCLSVLSVISIVVSLAGYVWTYFQIKADLKG